MIQDSHELRIENWEWRILNGEWRMENGEWRMENGELILNGEWRLVFEVVDDGGDYADFLDVGCG